MLSFREYITNPRLLEEALLTHFFTWLPDKWYLKCLFHIKMGRKLNLKHPNSFTEKIQWLKLYNRKPEYTQMVDKYAVKDYVANVVGREYVIPTFGVWDRPEDIDWDKLPNQFVLKTTHGGGSTGVIICMEKATFDKQKAVEKLNASLSFNIYKLFREWPYLDVKPRIIAEKYIQVEPGLLDLPDYKWYCFDGEPKYCQVIQDRNTKETIDFFDTEWHHQEFVGLNPNVSNANYMPPKPINLKSQISIARDLSKGIPFSRIDLYDVNGNIYFGEITFYPASGFGKFRPYKYDAILGQMIKLPLKNC